MTKSLNRIVQLVALSLAGAGLHAQTTATLEPGQGEAMTTMTRVTDVPTTWTSPAEEIRAVWLTADELLVPREELLKKLDALAGAHFNAIFVDTWFRGYVLYPGSALVPQYPAAVPHGDMLPWLIDEAHARKLQVHSWPEYGCYAYHTKDAAADKSRGALLDKYPELTATAADGSVWLHNKTFGDYYSLCPANPKSFNLLGSLYAEMMTRYKFDGLNLDRMRFPSADYCHCAHCKNQFEKDSGLPLKAFDAGTTQAARFLQWKRECLADGVAHVVEQVKAARPDAVMTAYVVGPDEMDEKAQSWDLWMRRDLLDVIGVSMYGDDIRPAAEKARALLGSKSGRLAAAINAGLPNSDFLLRNIGWARQLAPKGQFTWYGVSVMDDLDALKAGPYLQPSQWPVSEK